jgi:anti-sigma-K factor RskA
MTHDQIGELLGAYVLDAVSDGERVAVDAHVKSCSACAQELDLLRGVADRLALLVAEREPPPALRVRLLNLVAHDAEQESRQQPHAQAPALAPSAWWQRIPRLAYGAAAALAIAVLLVAVLVNRNGITVKTYSGSVVAQVVMVRGVRVSGATATVTVRSDHTTDVAFRHLALLPRGLAYELWLIPAHGAPVSLGGFQAAADRSYKAHVQRDAAGYALAAVTIERAPGNWPAPSPSSLFLAVKLGA